MPDIFNVDVLESASRALIPLLLAAIGGLVCERAGVFQVSLEGMMLVGCFAAVAGSYAAQSAAVGVLVAVAAGAAVSLVLAYGTVTRGANPIVVGIGLNLLAVGLTGFLLRAVFDETGVFSSERIHGLGSIAIPGLSDIPVIGRVLFDLSPLGYVALLLPFGIAYFLARTTFGLRLRGIGEHASASASLGLPVARTQYLAVVFSGVMCGLAGAQLALGNVVQFAEGMSAGRGWVAVVAVLLARARVRETYLICIALALTQAIGFRLQGAGWPVQLTDAIPYLVTLAVLVALHKRFTAGTYHVV